MRILAVTPWVPSHRRPRSLGLISALAADHEVRLVAATWDAGDDADLDALPFSTRGVRVARSGGIIRAALAIVRRRPLQQAYVGSRRVSSEISRQIKEFDPDLIYFNTIRSAQWRHGLEAPSATLAIDLDEFRSGYYDQQARKPGSLAWRLLARLEARRMIREEHRILEDFTSVLVSSPIDVDPTKQNLHLVRSPHALRELQADRIQTTRPSIVFVGRMSYAANVDAVLWFTDFVLPGLLAAAPDIQFDVVGDAPSKKIQALRGVESITVHGRVESVDHFYRRAWISIIPVTSATGVQMKLIESLAIGTPAVTTPLVARQAGVTNGVEVTIASTAEDWVDAILGLLDSKERRDRQSRSGCTWASQNYSRDEIEHAFHVGLFGTTPTRRDSTP